MNRRGKAEQKARFIRGIRDFFQDKGYLEVETPILSPFLLPEPSIEIFSSEYINFYGSNIPCYLIPSPELWMKRLLAEDFGNIFQITKAFRNAESIGALHNVEFSMCEWYTIDTDYSGNIGIIGELCTSLSRIIAIDPAIDMAIPFEKISMKEAFSRYASIDLDDFLGSPRIFITRNLPDILMSDTSTDEELFNKVFLTHVEPHLPQTRPLIIFDFPAIIPTFARRKSDSLYCERWELYIRGIEIANCFSEEIDPEKLSHTIRTEARAKEKASVPHAIDTEFPDFFSAKYPPCSGVALGIDRLFMALSGIKSINEVLLFPFSDIIKPHDSSKRGDV